MPLPNSGGKVLQTSRNSGDVVATLTGLTCSSKIILKLQLIIPRLEPWGILVPEFCHIYKTISLGRTTPPEVHNCIILYSSKGNKLIRGIKFAISFILLCEAFANELICFLLTEV